MGQGDVTRCVECGRLNLKAAERMAHHGFGCCGLRPAWEFYPVSREKECGNFTQAPAEQVKERIEWLDRKQVQHGKETS
jgi:hypothetical protein